MVMLKKEYEIIRVFIERPWDKLTFGEVKKISGKKSESYVFNSLKKFVRIAILKEQKMGNVVLYYFDTASLKAQAFAGFVAEYTAWSKKHIPLNDMERIASKIPTGFFIFIITGSYAKGMQKKSSDIDVVIICDDSTEPKKIYAELRHDCEMNIPKIHLYVFRKSEFLEMLLDKKANYGKEIARNNLILSGGDEYYRIIGEAIRNGFNG
jgi:predicted nucleotidyltransferase